MKQETIRGYFQNGAAEKFDNTPARQIFLATQIKRNEKVLNISVGVGVFR